MEDPFLHKFELHGDHPHPLRSNAPDAPATDWPSSQTLEEPTQVVEKLVAPARKTELNNYATIDIDDPDENEDYSRRASHSRCCTKW